MISKNKIKQIKALELKKFRNEEKLFVAEGNKLVATCFRLLSVNFLLQNLAGWQTKEI